MDGRGNGDSLVKWFLPTSPLDCPPSLIKTESSTKPPASYPQENGDRALTNQQLSSDNMGKKARANEKKKQKVLFEAEKVMRKIENRSSDDLVDPTFGQFRMKYTDLKHSDFEKIYIENNAKDAIRKMRLQVTANNDNSLKKELSLAEKKLFHSPYGQPLSHKLMANLGYNNNGGDIS